MARWEVWLIRLREARGLGLCLGVGVVICIMSLALVSLRMQGRLKWCRSPANSRPVACVVVLKAQVRLVCVSLWFYE